MTILFSSCVTTNPQTTRASGRATICEVAAWRAHEAWQIQNESSPGSDRVLCVDASSEGTHASLVSIIRGQLAPLCMS